VSTDPPVAGIPELQAFRAEVLSRKDLPTIPAVLARILTLVEGERTSGRDLVEVIEHDPVLTSRVLKLANSALFGLSRKVSTVPRAVVLVGFTTVRNLALGVKVWDSLAPGGRQKQQVETLWHHSAIVAAGAKLVAAKVKGIDPDISFTAGLLHDVGKLVIALKLGMRYWSLVEAATTNLETAAIERATLGVDHGQVGGWLAEAWRLPAPIVGAIRDHHQTTLVDQPEWTTAHAVHVADVLVRDTDLATGAPGPIAMAMLERTAARGLTAEEWLPVGGQLREEADAISGLFAAA
jgi:putative nucleotidyltransferase with HDIG domain